MPQYDYDSTLDQFTSKNPDFKPIKRDTSIRYKIDTLKFDKNEFIATSSMKDNYLGVIQSWKFKKATTN